MKCKKCEKDIVAGSVFCSFCGKKQETTAAKTRKRGNGEGSIYPKNGKYAATLILGLDENGKQIRKNKSGFATKRDAEEWLYSVKYNLETLDKKPRTVQSLWNTFSNGVMLKTSKNTQSHYRTAYSRLKSIHYRDIRTIKTNDIQEIVDQRGDDYYPARYIRDLMSKLFAIAISEGVVSYNPTKYIALPDHVTKSHQPFNLNDLVKMWDGFKAGDDICGYALLMCYTGMMPGEVVNATQKMIDLEQHTIIGAGLKTKVRREMPIRLPNCIVPVVERLMANSPNDRLWPRGRDCFYEFFREMVGKYELSDVTSYSCRHTTAKLLSAYTDAQDSEIRAYMRHSPGTMTEYYMHLDEVLTKAGNLIPDEAKLKELLKEKTEKSRS